MTSAMGAVARLRARSHFINPPPQGLPMTQKSESELLTDERLVMEYGRAPGTGDFYVVTRDGARHEIPDQLARRHFALVDLGLPYPFEDDEDGWAIGTRRGT